MNFKNIKLRFESNSYHLLYDVDECLYRKNGYKLLKDCKKVQYYVCIHCEVRGKVVEGTGMFAYTVKNQSHTHPSPKDLTDYEHFVENLKTKISDNMRSTREIYGEMISRYDYILSYLELRN